MSSFFTYLDSCPWYEVWAIIAILGCTLWVLVTTIRMVQDNSRANREFRDWITAKVSKHTKQQDHVVKVLTSIVEDHEALSAKCAKSFIEVTDLISQLNVLLTSHELQLQATRPPVTWTCFECPERSTQPKKDGWIELVNPGGAFLCPRCIE